MADRTRDSSPAERLAVDEGERWDSAHNSSSTSVGQCLVALTNILPTLHTRRRRVVCRLLPPLRRGVLLGRSPWYEHLIWLSLPRFPLPSSFVVDVLLGRSPWYGHHSVTRLRISCTSCVPPSNEASESTLAWPGWTERMWITLGICQYGRSFAQVTRYTSTSASHPPTEFTALDVTPLPLHLAPCLAPPSLVVDDASKPDYESALRPSPLPLPPKHRATPSVDCRSKQGESSVPAAMQTTP